MGVVWLEIVRSSNPYQSGHRPGESERQDGRGRNWTVGNYNKNGSNYYQTNLICRINAQKGNIESEGHWKVTRPRLSSFK